MGSEWIVLGFSVVALGVAFFIRGSARKTLGQATDLLSKKQDPPLSAVEEEQMPKKKKKDMSNFKGFDWKWAVEGKSSQGLPVPDAGDTLIKVFLQEIRDEARVHAKNQQITLDGLSDELKEFNKLMRQLFGTEDP